MALPENFRRQVDLLLRTVPFIAKESCFALKGGTAINLFFRDLPRLSVDIDLTYTLRTPMVTNVTPAKHPRQEFGTCFAS